MTLVDGLKLLTVLFIHAYSMKIGKHTRIEHADAMKLCHHPPYAK